MVRGWLYSVDLAIEAVVCIVIVSYLYPLGWPLLGYALVQIAVLVVLFRWESWLRGQLRTYRDRGGEA